MNDRITKNVTLKLGHVSLCYLAAGCESSYWHDQTLEALDASGVAVSFPVEESTGHTDDFETMPHSLPAVLSRFLSRELGIVTSPADVDEFLRDDFEMVIDDDEGTVYYPEEVRVWSDANGRLRWEEYTRREEASDG